MESKMAEMTKHMQKRMSQRGITGEMVELALQFGIVSGDRTALSRDDLEALLHQLRRAQRITLKLLDKGGIVVVEAGGSLITTYNRSSFDRRRGRDGSRRSQRHHQYR